MENDKEEIINKRFEDFINFNEKIKKAEELNKPWIYLIFLTIWLLFITKVFGIIPESTDFNLTNIAKSITCILLFFIIKEIIRITNRTILAVNIAKSDELELYYFTEEEIIEIEKLIPSTALIKVKK